MNSKGRAPVFFLGANTAEGFYSLYDEFFNPRDDVRLFIIKGGPGTGKSSVMKAVAARAEALGEPVERIYCSSDPESLDAVLLPGKNAAVCDGTPPHPVELRYPGIGGRILDTGLCWDARKLLEAQDTIRELTRANRAEHTRCLRFLSVAGRLQGDAFRIAAACTDGDRIERFARRFAARRFGEKKEKDGTVSRRFLSAFTPRGHMVFYDTISALCPQIVALEDSYGAVSSLLLQHLLREARSRGLHCIAAPCVLRPSGTPEHLLLPELGLCIFTSNAWHPAPDSAERLLHATRFMDAEKLLAHKNRLTFDRRAGAELLWEATAKLENAKLLHDRLEARYIAAMDFGKTEKMKNELLEELFGSY